MTKTLIDDLILAYEDGINLDVEASKYVLCARSSVFRNIFCSNVNKLSTNIIEINDWDYYVVESFIRFIHTDKFEQNLPNSPRFMEMIKNYKVDAFTTLEERSARLFAKLKRDYFANINLNIVVYIKDFYIMANEIILRGRSPAFQYLIGNKRAKEITLNVRGFDSDTVMKFIHFLHTNEYSNYSIDFKKLIEYYKIHDFRIPSRLDSETNFYKEIRGFFKLGSLLDVKVHFGDNVIEASKFLLCTRSPLIQAIFLHDSNVSKTNSIRIDCFEICIVKKFLHFIHTDNVHNLKDDAMKLYHISDYYAVESLRIKCYKNLFANLNITNSVDYLLFSRDLALDTLNTMALNLIKTHLNVSNLYYFYQQCRYFNLFDLELEIARYMASNYLECTNAMEWTFLPPELEMNASYKNSGRIDPTSLLLVSRFSSFIVKYENNKMVQTNIYNLYNNSDSVLAYKVCVSNMPSLEFGAPLPQGLLHPSVITFANIDFCNYVGKVIVVFEMIKEETDINNCFKDLFNCFLIVLDEIV